jgi:hypothetical protein
MVIVNVADPKTDGLKFMIELFAALNRLPGPAGPMIISFGFPPVRVVRFIATPLPVAFQCVSESATPGV